MNFSWDHIIAEENPCISLSTEKTENLSEHLTNCSGQLHFLLQMGTFLNFSRVGIDADLFHLAGNVLYPPDDHNDDITAMGLTVQCFVGVF